MRSFTLTLSLPQTCDCCGQALPTPAEGPTLATYTVELSEGPVPTEISIGNAAKVTLGGGRLEVKLRQRRGSNRGWGLRPFFNTDAFGREKHEFVRDGNDEFGWYVFRFDLPQFKPWYSTWWAQLEFVEVVPFSRDFNNRPKESHNAAVLKVKMNTLA